MPPFLSRRAIAAAITAILTLVTLTIVVVDNGPDHDLSKPRRSVTVTIGTKANPAAPTVTADLDQQAGPAQVRESADPTPADTGPDIHEDARDETPAGVDPAKAAAGLSDNTAQGLGKPQPVGGAQNYSCRSNPVRNYSSRNGQRVLLFVIHYTVSRPGSLDAIRRLFNTPSFGASSHLGLEVTGRCEQWVPFALKSWTEGNFNGRSEAVEIMATGSESRQWWLSQPIFTHGILASIIRDRLRANGLPLRFVDPIGCGVQKAGWTDHDHLECGNSHHDVSPNFPLDVLARQVAAGAPAAKPLTARQRAHRAGGSCSPRRQQAALNRRGYHVGPVDGVIGPRTRTAIKRLQRKRGIHPAGGVVGIRTGPALNLTGC